MVVVAEPAAAADALVVLVSTPADSADFAETFVVRFRGAALVALADAFSDSDTRRSFGRQITLKREAIHGSLVASCRCDVRGKTPDPAANRHGSTPTRQNTPASPPHSHPHHPNPPTIAPPIDPLTRLNPPRLPIRPEPSRAHIAVFAAAPPGNGRAGDSPDRRYLQTGGTSDAAAESRHRRFRSPARAFCLICFFGRFGGRPQFRCQKSGTGVLEDRPSGDRLGVPSTAADAQSIPPPPTKCTNPPAKTSPPLPPPPPLDHHTRPPLPTTPINPCPLPTTRPQPAHVQPEAESHRNPPRSRSHTRSAIVSPRSASALTLAGQVRPHPTRATL